MTESEAVEKLKNMRLFMQITDKNSEHKFAEDDYKAKEIAIQALEKQIPKKPKNRYKTRYIWDSAYCPICNCGITARWVYCQCCGQKLDWGDEE